MVPSGHVIQDGLITVLLRTFPEDTKEMLDSQLMSVVQEAVVTTL